MKSLADLHEHYRTTLVGVIAPFEARRKSIVRRVGITLAAVLAASAAALAIGLANQAPQVALIAVIPGAIAVALVAFFSMRGYTSEFKHAVVSRVVEFADPGLSYSPGGGVGEGSFRASRLFEHSIDRYSCEDLVSGALGRTAVRFSEVHAEYKTTTRDSKGRTHTHWHTIFKGLFFVADFNKDFRGTTVVVPDVAEKMLGGWLGQLFQSMNFSRSGQLVKLESPEFEKYFAVYADDQLEARYILTPALMERIVEFRKRPDTSDQVFISFARSCVFVAIPCQRNMFEPRLLRTLMDFEVIKEYYLDLALAAGIVENLDLNTRLWTKE